jgi:hypothetical protein
MTSIPMQARLLVQAVWQSLRFVARFGVPPGELTF